MSSKEKEEEWILPTTPTKSKLVNPNRLLIFGKPKIGKTTAVAALKNCLIINLEDKVQTADGMILYVDSITKLKSLLKTIKEKGCPYDYIAIDTLTKLEEMCIPEAERLYMRTPMGKESWIKKDDKGKLLPTCGKAKYGNILFLPNGSGYQYLREAFKNIIHMIEEVTENVIYIAHVKEVNIVKDGAEFTSSDINLTGKNKYTISADAQAIAYMTRINNKNYLCFQVSDDLLAGCKIKRLEGRDILISEYDENENLITHWDEVYIKEKEEEKSKKLTL